MSRTPLIIGHRGASGYRPEHTRSAYTLAFELGADAVEPDVVPTRDGVLVVRHENDISETTDIADHPEFADRRASKTVDGVSVTGWFTEDFTWDELSTLRTRERLPELRPGSAGFDGEQGILRLVDVLDIVVAAAQDSERELGVVIEIKHATYFSRIGLDIAPLLADTLAESGWRGRGLPTTIEAFELGVLERLRGLGALGEYVFLMRHAGRPFDRVAAEGSAAPTYRAMATPSGLDAIAPLIDGISVEKRMLLRPDLRGRARGSTIVSDAHARGLRTYTWTCRPENQFLIGQYREGRGAATFGDYEGEWAMIRDSGVDGVFVDHPDLAVPVFRGAA